MAAGKGEWRLDGRDTAGSAGRVTELSPCALIDCVLAGRVDDCDGRWCVIGMMVTPPVPLNGSEKLPASKLVLLSRFEVVSVVDAGSRLEEGVEVKGRLGVWRMGVI